MSDGIGESQQRISEGEFRHYVFDIAELRAETERFLSQAGYHSKVKKYVGLVEPDFRAGRASGSSAFEVMGMIRQNLDEALDALIRLAAMKAANRDADCVLVLPPINEYQLIEWLTDNDARWYFGIHDSRLLLWFCNPGNHSTICFVGSPSDAQFRKHFYMMDVMSFDRRAPLLFRNRLLADEEEDD